MRAAGKGPTGPIHATPKGVLAGRDLPSPGFVGTVPTSVPPLSSRCFSLWEGQDDGHGHSQACWEVG